MKASLLSFGRWFLCLTFLVMLAGSARAQEGPGFALRFDGAGDNVLINHTNALNAFPLTVTTWLRTTQNISFPNPSLVGKLISGASNGWQVYLVSGNVRARYFADGSNYLSGGASGLAGGLNGGSVADNVFHHVAFTVDTLGGSLYVDGALRDSRAWVGTPGAPTTTELLRFGLGNNASFIGTLDEVTVWNIALTATEIQQSMHRSLVGTEPGLIAYYRFNEASGNTTADSAPAGGDNQGFLGGPTRILSGVAFVPSVTTLSASALAQTSATLNGTANPNNASASGRFEWGATTNFGNLTPPQALGSGIATTNFSQVLTGLTAGVVYYFRAVAANSAGVTLGSVQTFSIGPSVETLPASALAQTAATLNGLANPNATETSAWFEWGFTTNYGSVTPTQALGSGLATTNFSEALTGLTPGLSIHFRAVASNSLSVAFGADQSFPRLAQRTYLKASNTAAGDGFGFPVAMSGDTLVVGASAEHFDAGAAYVFVRRGNSWVQQAYLKPSNTENFDQFGFSVAVSGDTVVVGAPDESSNATGVNGDGSDNGAFNSGAAYVFVRNGTNWTQQAYLKASNTEARDNFGGSVAVSGETVVVGATGESSNATGVNADGSNNTGTNSGAAYVFVRSGTNWSQQAYLKASNTGQDDSFGGSVAVSGDTVVVGAFGEDSNATGVNGDQSNNSANRSGAAYVFVRNGTMWTQQAYLKAGNAGLGDAFGSCVAVSDDTVVVGAPMESSNATGVNGDGSNNIAVGAGAAYLFVRSGTTWTQQAYLKASNTEVIDNFGGSVAVSDDTVVVGARQEDSNATGVNGDASNNFASSSGAAYVFARSGTNWSFQDYLKASNTEALDDFGTSVAVSGDIVVIGADGEDSNAIGINGDQSDNSASDSGAAYVFGPLLPPAPEISVTLSNTNIQFVVVGSDTQSRFFFIRNTGNADLTGLTLTIDGPDAAFFTITDMPTAPVAPGRNTAFTVRFAPTSTGAKTAMLHIANNDEDENPFDMVLGGLSLSFTEDTDGDGLNDASEFLLAPLGFDFQVSQPFLVNLLFNNANGAGLFTQSQLQGLNVTTPLLAKDPVNGHFKLTIGVEKATQLTNFLLFPMTAPQTIINAEGKLEFQFSAPDNAAFFRLEAR